MDSVPQCLVISSLLVIAAFNSHVKHVLYTVFFTCPMAPFIHAHFLRTHHEQAQASTLIMGQWGPIHTVYILKRFNSNKVRAFVYILTIVMHRMENLKFVCFPVISTIPPFHIVHKKILGVRVMDIWKICKCTVQNKYLKTNCIFVSEMFDIVHLLSILCPIFT